MEFGCGQCLPCRFNRRRLWTGRLMLESLFHEETCFITLTYNDESYPTDGSLSKDDYKNFIKRLRRKLEPQKIRYYCVGEYGDNTLRAHYHIILFGFGCVEGLIKPEQINQLNLFDQNQKILMEAWQKKGQIHVGETNSQSIQYSCGHIVKGMSKNDSRLGGKTPEFARMSLRPGIGHKVVERIAEWHTTKEGARYIAENGDVVNSIRLDGKFWPLGAYLKSEIKKAIGMESNVSDLVIQRIGMERIEQIKENGYDVFAKTRKYHALKAKQIHSTQMIRRTL